MRHSIKIAIVGAVSLLAGGCLHAPMPWSPDGNWIAYTVEVRPMARVLKTGWLFEPAAEPARSARSTPTGYRLWATRADSGASALLDESAGPITAPAWSPDGRAMAFGRIVPEAEGAGRFEVVVLEGPTRRRVISSRALPRIDAEASLMPAQAIAWSPDGRYLAVPQFSPQGLAILRADNGRLVNAINDAFLPSWSPEGGRLAFYVRGAGDSLYMVESAIGQPRMLVEVGQAGQAPAWARDGMSLIVVARRSIPRGAEPPGDQADLLRVQVNTGAVEAIRAFSTEPVLGRDRSVEGVTFALDRDGDNLFSSTVVDGQPNQVVWCHPRENTVYKRFSIVDHSAAMGSLSLSPDGRTLAARIGPVDRLSAPALCDLESSDLRSRLLTPDDSSRVEWIACLVASARSILAALPVASTEPKTPAATRIDRPNILPILTEFEPNSDPTYRLRRIGRLGRPLCDRPADAPPADPELAPILAEARLFFDYLREDYAAALESLEALEARADTPQDRARLQVIRVQIFLNRGEIERARKAIAYLKDREPGPTRRLEWAGGNYQISEEPTTGRGWPDYLALRAESIRAMMREDGPGHHANPDNPRFNSRGLDPLSRIPNVFQPGALAPGVPRL